MFIDFNGTWIEKKSIEVMVACSNCGNTTNHIIVGAFSSPHIGWVFLPKRTQLGTKKYFLVCPVCGFSRGEISKQEMLSLK